MYLCVCYSSLWRTRPCVPLLAVHTYTVYYTHTRTLWINNQLTDNFTYHTLFLLYCRVYREPREILPVPIHIGDDRSAVMLVIGHRPPDTPEAAAEIGKRLRTEKPRA